MTHWLLGLCFGLFSLHRSHSLPRASPPISVSIQPNWPEPPLLIQILEAFALERPSSFFDLLDAVTESWSPGAPTELATDRQLYEHVKHVIQSQGLLDGPGEMESFDASLALKESHPRIEALRAWSASTVGNNLRASSLSQNTTTEAQGCQSWVEILGHKACDHTLLQKLVDSVVSSGEGSVPHQTFPFDHFFQSPSLQIPPMAVLYASGDPSSFGPLHQVLSRAARQAPPRVSYLFRWHLLPHLSPSLSPSPSYLSGWAAALDIKKSEYLTLDDRPVESESDNQLRLNSKKEQNTPDLEATAQGKSKLTSLKATELADIGLKATQYIMSSSLPLKALRHLVENFPQHAHTLVTEWVPEPIETDLEAELSQNALSSLDPGQSALWMNGLDLSGLGLLDRVNFFKLIEIMRSERRWMAAMKSLGLSYLDAKMLIADDAINRALNPDSTANSNPMQMDSSILGQRFDARDTAEGGATIIWLNDLENDLTYGAWPKDLRYVLRPTFPGQLQTLARNLINVVVGVNLTDVKSLRLLGDMIEAFISHSLPIRWGVVPVVRQQTTSAEGVMHRAFWNLTQSAGPIKTLKFIAKFLRSSASETVDVERFRSEALDLISAATGTSVDENDKVDSTKDNREESFQVWLDKANRYTSRLALCSSDDSVPACMLINGKFFVVDEDFRSHLQRAATLHTQFIQHQVYFDLLTNDQKVADYMLDLPGVHPARNDFVFPSEDHPLQFANLVDALSSSTSSSAHVSFRNGVESVGGDHTERPRVTLWLTGDLDSPAGSSAIFAALKLLADPPAESMVEVSFVHLLSEKAGESPAEVAAAVAHLVASDCGSRFSAQDLRERLKKCGHTSGAHEAEAEKKLSELILERDGSLDVDGLKKPENVWSTSEKFSQTLGLSGSNFTVFINGRTITTSLDHKFKEADLRMLVEFETKQRCVPILNALRQLNQQKLSAWAPKLPLITSVIGSVLIEANEQSMFAPASKARSSLHRSRLGHHSSIKVGNNKTSLFDLDIILDPTSETAQRWSAVLETFSHRSDMSLKIWFNPRPSVSELPIKRFFRTTFANAIAFDSEGNVTPPRASFHDIPPDVLLTLATETPHAWLALPKESVHDLDNMMLSELPDHYSSRGVDAVFELEHIIIAGHAREVTNGRPPRGLQVVLTDQLRGYEVDTIIMANLGYFQFKSAPGLHRLTIRPGRSSELYTLDSLNALESDSLSAPRDDTITHSEICLTTFTGVTLFPKFAKRPGREKENLIKAIDTESGGTGTGISAPDLTKLVGQFKDLANGILGNSKTSGVSNSGSSTPVINIFTVASGLLYERMAYLMCVSVMRHTKSKVKFWFISNFLSPSFKKFIPHLAREYGFEYQLVTYQWPPWLRAQREKQRVIWGYKILFLDVLFPLEVDRVIFVDSDQIVRTDLQALVDLDLKGAPYAYTPMCNDRNETKGFRFWDTGYWKESLQGKPYHISALYVVDLRVFRAVAAGDQLRQHYQALSADPGSLANLDQDLPNNMQSALPIYSLEQSWLWCETWCSDDGLKVAKTIDLCNNPLTHEPKLMRARRLIPEWDVYDREVAKLAAKVKGEASKVGGDVDGKGDTLLFNVQAGEVGLGATPADGSAGGNVDVIGQETSTYSTLEKHHQQQQGDGHRMDEL